MKILCTGSDSFIGAVLCPMLEAEGHTVYRYDAKAGLDICDEAKIADAIKSCAAIMHLAACSTPAACEADPVMAQAVNVDAVRLINRLRGDKPLFYPNTNIGYGAHVRLPVYDETAPMEPNSVYGKTKCEGERLILEHGHCVVFRLASLFGVSPSMRWDLLLNFMVKEAAEKAALEVYEGHARRNFLHVQDMARAFIFALENYRRMKGQVYNIGLDICPRKRELAEMIKARMPVLKITETAGSDPDARDYVVSSAKLYALGWQPSYTIGYGILELMQALHG